MKIAVISNFGHDNFAEYFVAHELSEHNANVMCERLNQHPAAEYDPGSYTPVADDYELKSWKP